MGLPAKSFAQNTVNSHAVPKRILAPPIQPPRFAPVPKRAVPIQPKFAPLPSTLRINAVLQPKVASGQPKFYPNLNPAAAALKADPAEFMHLQSTFDQSYYHIR